MSEDQAPDYSIDRWVKMAQDLGGNINSMVGDAKHKEEELDDEEAEAKKKPVDKVSDDHEEEKDITKDKETEGAWQRLKQIAKERKEKEEQKDSSKEQVASDKKSS